MLRHVCSKVTDAVRTFSTKPARLAVKGAGRGTSVSSSIKSPSKSPVKSAKAKPRQVKEVILSWLISKNDLEGQKRKAIESILNRGNKLQLRLENKNKKGFYSPTDNEIEARNLLIQNVEKIVETAGGQRAKPSQGTVQTRMMLYFEPKPK